MWSIYGAAWLSWVLCAYRYDHQGHEAAAKQITFENFQQSQAVITNWTRTCKRFFIFLFIVCSPIFGEICHSKSYWLSFFERIRIQTSDFVSLPESRIIKLFWILWMHIYPSWIQWTPDMWDLKFWAVLLKIHSNKYCLAYNCAGASGVLAVYSELCWCMGFCLSEPTCESGFGFSQRKQQPNNI